MSTLVTCAKAGCDNQINPDLLTQCDQCGTPVVIRVSEDTSETPAVAPLRVTVCSRTFEVLPGTSVGLGRSEDYPLNEYFLKCTNVSRMHAQLRFSDDGRVYIKDTKSANHTFIDGEEIETNVELEVLPGQALRFASDVDITLEWTPAPASGHGPTRLG